MAPPMRVKSSEAINPPMAAKAKLATASSSPALLATLPSKQPLPVPSATSGPSRVLCSTQPAHFPAGPRRDVVTESRAHVGGDSDAIGARDSSGVLDTLAAMTPSSKTTYAKACIMKAKLLQKMNRLEDALALYLEARELFPDAQKLEGRIQSVRAAIAGDTDGEPSVMELVQDKPEKASRGVLAPINAEAVSDKQPSDDCERQLKKKKRRQVSDGEGDPDWKPATVAAHTPTAAVTPTPYSLPTAEPADGDNSMEADPSNAVNLNASLGLKLERNLLHVLNTGDMKELMKIDGVGKKRALNIITFREQERPLEQVGWPPGFIIYIVVPLFCSTIHLFSL